MQVSKSAMTIMNGTAIIIIADGGEQDTRLATIRIDLRKMSDIATNAVSR